MARTKQTARRSTGGKAPRKQLASGCGLRLRDESPCYQRTYGRRHVITTSRFRRHSSAHTARRPESRAIIANFTGTKYFPQFINLPTEIKHMIWAFVAEEPRVVAVHTGPHGGFHACVPPLLQVCAESRAIALRHYSLAFARKRILRAGDEDSDISSNVYFNFNRDTLYLREHWNKNAKGPWSCVTHLRNMINDEDIQRVKKIGFDVSARSCCLNMSADNSHYFNLMHWDSLETLFIGYEEGKLGFDCPIMFEELPSDLHTEFMVKYRSNPGLVQHGVASLDSSAAIRHLTQEVPIAYHGQWSKPENFLQRLKLVRVRHL